MTATTKPLDGQILAEAITVLSRLKGAGARLALEHLRLTYGAPRSEAR